MVSLLLIIMRKILSLLLALALLQVHSANAAMSSTHYQVPFDSINSGGSDLASSTNYGISDTIGEQGTGYASSTNYSMHSGYRQNEETTLSLAIGAQENSTETAWTALSISSKTVTLQSVAAFATGSRIGVVENKGLSQKMVVGQVTAINGLVLSVDQWDGATSTISLTPSGGDDFAYRMDGSALEFGALVPNLPNTVTKDDSNYIEY